MEIQKLLTKEDALKHHEVAVEKKEKKKKDADNIESDFGSMFHFGGPGKSK